MPDDKVIRERPGGTAKDGKPYLSGVCADSLDDAVALLRANGRFPGRAALRWR